jgi:phosphoglycolate phosphatase
MRLLLFDVDLTLISTGGAGIHALNRACQKVIGLADAMEGVQPGGKTDPAIIREIFVSRAVKDADPDAMGRVLDAYLTFLREEVANSASYRILPGIVSILDELMGRADAMIGLATGNVEPGARIKLERGGLNGYFSFGGFGSDSENRTVLVQRAAAKAAAHVGGAFPAREVFVIGDTPRDIDAGRGAGFNTVGVATGSHSVEELSRSGATLAIADFERDREAFMKVAFAE